MEARHRPTRQEPSEQPRFEPPVRPVTPSAGLVGGRYELGEPIGAGTFAVTHTAMDTRLGRTVAIKVLRDQFARDRQFAGRFEREARHAASVSHPNIVDVYDYGAFDQTFYIAMQYVPGRDLKQVLTEDGPLPVPVAARVIGQVLRGLTAIHAAGIIHRDIKPQNVLIGPDGVARVTDFGVAQASVDEGLTSHGTTVGTASYMAPEQARGGALSQGTDLYAVGVMLFELLTGRLPFEAANPMAVMLAHLQRQPPRPNEVAPAWVPPIPDAVEAIVMRALAKDPRDRFPDARSMAEALQDATRVSPDAGERALVAPAGPADQTAALPVRHEGVAAGTGLLGAAVPLSDGDRTRSPHGAHAEPAAPRVGVPRSVAQPVPAVVRPQRRQLGWLGPALFALLAVLVSGGVVLANVMGGGGDDAGDDGAGGRGENPGVALVTGSPTASVTGTAPGADRGLAAEVTVVAATAVPTNTATARVPPTATPSPPATATAAPTDTATPAPTRTPIPPTATATRVPTRAPTRTPTATATRVPTRTPTAVPPTETPPPPPTIIPTASPTPIPVIITGDIQPGNSDESDIEPTESSESLESGGAAVVSSGEPVTIPASAWEGGMPVDAATYGGVDAIAIYGANTGMSSASISFELLEEPTGPSTITVMGMGDEYAGDVQLEVDINGQSSVTTSQFGDYVNQDSQWTTATIDAPAGLLRAGVNTLTITNLDTQAASASPPSPYVLLSDVVVTPNASAAIGNGAVVSGSTNAVPVSPVDVAAAATAGDNSGRGSQGNGKEQREDKKGKGGDDGGDDD